MSDRLEAIKNRDRYWPIKDADVDWLVKEVERIREIHCKTVDEVTTLTFENEQLQTRLDDAEDRMWYFIERSEA